MNKDNRSVLIWIITIAIAPIFIILIFGIIIKAVSNNNLKDAIIIFDLSKSISLIDYLTIYAALLGIGVTALLTWGIFNYTNKKEEMEELHKRTAIYSDLLFLLNQIFQYEENKLLALAISDNWIERIVLCKKYMSNTQYNVLQELYGLISNLIKARDTNNSLSTLSEHILDKITLPFYSVYKSRISKDDIGDITILLNETYVEILNAIYPNKKKIISRHKSGKYKNGKNFYECKEQGNTLIYEVWGETDKQLCRASIKDKKICTGYADFNSYQGYWVDGKQNGEGKECEKSIVLKEGYWKDSVLINGKVYNVPLGKDGEDVTQIEHFFVSANSQGKQLKIADYTVCDGKLQTAENIRTCYVLPTYW